MEWPGLNDNSQKLATTITFSIDRASNQGVLKLQVETDADFFFFFKF